MKLVKTQVGRYGNAACYLLPQLLKLFPVLKIYGSLDRRQVVIHILILGSTCPSTILKLFVQQHHFAGPREGIGMRIHVTFHGMYFCHAYQVLIAGDSSL
jgi:hypothetical protein